MLRGVRATDYAELLERSLERNARITVALRGVCAAYHEALGHRGPWVACTQPVCLKAREAIDG